MLYITQQFEKRYFKQQTEFNKKIGKLNIQTSEIKENKKFLVGKKEEEINLRSV